MTALDQYGSVRYLVDDVAAAVDFYTTHLGFIVTMNAPPAIAQVTRRSAAAVAVRPDDIGRACYSR